MAYVYDNYNVLQNYELALFRTLVLTKLFYILHFKRNRHTKIYFFKPICRNARGANSNASVICFYRFYIKNVI